MRNKFKEFFKSFSTYGFGSVVGSMIPVILLPIVTKMIPDAKYLGINDLLNTYSLFFSFIVLCGLNDAVARLYYEYDNNEDKSRILSSSLYLVIIFFIVLLVICGFLSDYIQIKIYGEKNIDIFIVFILMIFSNSIYFILIQGMKIENKIKPFLKMNLFTPLISYSVSIYLLLKGMYLIALPIGFILSRVLVSVYFWWLNREKYSIKKFNLKTSNNLMKIGIVLMPTYLIFWVLGSLDRIMLNTILGNSAVGIYSVGAKVAMISGFMNTAFTNAWQYFTFSNMKEENHTKMISMFLEFIIVIIAIILGFSCSFNQLIFNLLFTGDYIKGNEVFIYLLLSPLILILYQILSNQLILANKSILITPILLIGAIVNIFLNYNLIPLLGIKGAAISTFLGYYISFLVIFCVAYFSKLIIINKIIIFNLAFIVMQVLIYEWITKDNYFLLLLSNIFVVIIELILYYKTLIKFKGIFPSWLRFPR